MLVLRTWSRLLQCLPASAPPPSQQDLVWLRPVGDVRSTAVGRTKGLSSGWAVDRGNVSHLFKQKCLPSTCLAPLSFHLSHVDWRKPRGWQGNQQEEIKSLRESCYGAHLPISLNQLLPPACHTDTSESTHSTKDKCLILWRRHWHM